MRRQESLVNTSSLCKKECHVLCRRGVLEHYRFQTEGACILPPPPAASSLPHPCIMSIDSCVFQLSQLTTDRERL